VITDDDQVFRMAETMFKRLLANPAEAHLKQFAGQRVRFADIVVELHHRKPERVVRIGYYYLHFNQDGSINYERFMRDGAVIAEAGLADTRKTDADPTRVINATAKFAQRERDHAIWWQPDDALEKVILDASVDLTSCKRLYSGQTPHYRRHL